MPADEDLRYEVSDRIAEISLARAPVNALSLSLLEQLIAALRRAAADEDVRAVVLTSAQRRLGLAPLVRQAGSRGAVLAANALR